MVLVTRDRDFTDLAHYPLNTHAGIIWLDITPATMSDVHTVLCQSLQTFTAEQLHGGLLIVSHATSRLRRPTCA